MSAESTIEILSSLSQDYKKQYAELHLALKDAVKKEEKENVLRIAKQMNNLLENILDPSFRLDKVSDTCGARVKRTLKKVGLCFLSGLASYLSFKASPYLSSSSSTTVDDVLFGGGIPEYSAFITFLVLTLKLSGDIITSAKSLEIRQMEDVQELKQNYGELSEKLAYLQTLHKSGSLTMSDIKKKFGFGYKKSKMVKSVKKSKRVGNVKKSKRVGSAKKSKRVGSIKKSKNRK